MGDAKLLGCKLPERIPPSLDKVLVASKKLDSLGMGHFRQGSNRVYAMASSRLSRPP